MSEQVSEYVLRTTVTVFVVCIMAVFLAIIAKLIWDFFFKTK